MAIGCQVKQKHQPLRLARIKTHSNHAPASRPWHRRSCHSTIVGTIPAADPPASVATLMPASRANSVTASRSPILVKTSIPRTNSQAPVNEHRASPTRCASLRQCSRGMVSRLARMRDAGRKMARTMRRAVRLFTWAETARSEVRDSLRGDGSTVSVVTAGRSGGEPSCLTRPSIQRRDPRSIASARRGLRLYTPAGS